MMNSKTNMNTEVLAFIQKDRFRLFVERNKFKALAEAFERELHHTKNRSRHVILALMTIIVMLIGVIAYVSNIS